LGEGGEAELAGGKHASPQAGEAELAGGKHASPQAGLLI